MTVTSTLSPDSDIDRIFGAVVRPQTYRNFLYLLISFPLGVFYFVTMMTGFWMGVGTAVIVVGFLILAFTLALAHVFAGVERGIMKTLLGATFETRAPLPRGVRAKLTDRRAWTTLVYLFLRFPLGILSLIVSVMFLASIPIMAVPLLYTWLPVTVGWSLITTSEDALLVSLFGCVFFLMWAHVINGVAAISRRLAMAML